MIREDLGCLVLDLLVSLLVEGSQCYFSLDHTNLDHNFLSLLDYLAL